MSEPIKYTYDTKCRVCGGVQSWFFAYSGTVKYKDFHFAVNDYIQYPRLTPCKSCDKKTVQDVICYTDNVTNEP